MINIEGVRATLCALTGLDNAELDCFLPIINNAILATEGLVDEENHSDERVEYLAGAKANYEIQLASANDNVTSFSAGDVSLTQSANGASNAKTILDEAMKNVANIICDNGFAFIGV